jgi:RNA polymerase sigma factor (sigma-70 family)
VDQEILLAYADRIFAFCRKRLDSIDAAEELSQEIFAELLNGLGKYEIKNLHAWIWRIARNRYARFVSKERVRFASFGDGSPFESIAQEEKEDNSETLEAVSRAIRSIARQHREVLIDYYIRELTYAQIAEKYGITVNAVGLRLKAGRRKLKERWQTAMTEKTIYEKIDWSISANGDMNPFRYLDRQVSRAIAKACYDSPQSVEEISEATGIPCVYIEDELPDLLNGEALVRRGGKYLANFIVHTKAFQKRAVELLSEEAEALAPMIAALLEEYDIRLRATGFEGNEKPNGNLWWLYIPILLRKASDIAREKHGPAARGDFRPRLDGSSGWFMIDECEEKVSRLLTGCNRYYVKGRFTYYWTARYLSEEIGKYHYRLETAGAVEPNELDEALIAEGIKLGHIEKAAGGYRWAIPAFTKGQARAFDAVMTEIAGRIDLLGPMSEMYELYQAHIPKRLHGQIGGVFGAQWSALTTLICMKLEAEGVLERPKNEYFTDQIMLVK